MACRRSVQNQYLYPIVFDNIEHGCLKIACIQGYCLPRLKINFKIICFLHAPDTVLQFFHVVTGFRDMMSSTHIKPFPSVQQISELFFHGIKCRFQGIRILFTERMEVKPVYLRQVKTVLYGFVKLCPRYTKP